MTFRLFPWLAAAARRYLLAPDTFLRVRHAQRPHLERTGERLDARTHSVRGSYLGLLVGVDVTR